MDQNLWEHILEVSRDLVEIRELGSLLNEVMDQAIMLVGAEQGCVVLLQPDGSLNFSVKRGQIGADGEKPEDQVSLSVLGQVVETKQPLFLFDALHDSHFSGAEWEGELGPHSRPHSMLCVPLLSRGEALGAIYVENRSLEAKFNEENGAALVIFAKQAAGAVKNARLYQEVQESLDELETRIEIRTSELRFAVEQLEQEISERLRVERSLRESERRYRLLIENVPTVAWMAGRDMKAHFISANVEQVYGYSAAEILQGGHTIWIDRFHPADKKRVLAAFERLFTRQEPYDVEYRIQRKDGAWIWINDRANTVEKIEGQLYAYGVFSDITGRKHAAEALRESEERYRTLFSQAQDTILVENDQAQIVDANQAASKLFGYSIEQLLQMKTTDLETPEFRGVPKASYYTLEDESVSAEFETVVRCPDGTEKPIWVTIASFKLGEQKLFLNIIRDLTERKQVETALQQSEARLRAFIGALPDLVFVFDQEGRYIEYFETQGDLALYPESGELRGSSVYDVLPPQLAQQFMATIRETIAQGRPQTLEYSLDLPVGRYWFEGRTAPIAQMTGGLAAVVWIARDITERKHTDQALQQHNREFALINQASQAFNSTLELGQVLQTILEEMHQLLNITATSFWLVVPETQELVCRRATGPGSETLLGWRLKPGQGLTGQVAQQGKPLIVADTSAEVQHFGAIEQRIGVDLRSLLSIPLQVKGEVIGVLNLNDTQVGRFSAADLPLLEPIAATAASAVKNASLFNEVEQARKAAEQANQTKSIFLATMSHELRTPLNGILGYAQILKRDPALAEHQNRSLDTIEQSGQHLLTLINDILDLSKIEAGKMELNFTDFHLPTFLNNIAAMIGIRAEQKGISFVYVPFDFVDNMPLPFSPEGRTLPAGVRADQQRLRQVLVNLLGNAVKFTQIGVVAFKVGPVQDELFPTSKAAAARPAQRRRIRFQVEDTGIGIEPEQLDLIFQPFEQVGDQRLQTEGTGLGLSISHHMVQMMGGKLKVESRPGRGSMFWFELDLLELLDWVEVPKRSNQIVGYEGQQQKVLVIDDNEQNRTVLFDLLSPLGFEVFQANNGADGLKTAQKIRPNVVVIDLILPGTSGTEVARRIRQSPQLKGIVIIAASADVLERSKHEALAAGCDSFITKPIQIEVLLDNLQRLLGLQWIYESVPGLKQQPADTAAVPAELIPPSAEALTVLLEFALMGDVAAIREQADRLDKLDEKYRPFTNELRRLGQRFQVNKLGKFIKKYLEQN